MSLISFKNELKSQELYLRDVLQSHLLANEEKNAMNNLLEALQYIRYGLVANVGLIQDLISPESASMGPLASIHIDEDVLIDETQEYAVQKAISMNNLLVIQGPPGAGKTTVIVEMIKQIKRAHPDAKIIVSSQTHVAVDNVIEKLMEKTEFDGKLARVRQNEKTEEAVHGLDVDGIIEEYLSDAGDTILNAIVEENSENAAYNNTFLSRFRADIMLSKDIIGVTVNSLKGCHFQPSDILDYAIIDEVGKMTFAEIMFVARFVKKLVLIGDPMQLPPELFMFSDNDVYDKGNYRRIEAEPYINTLFNSINSNCKIVLDKQYRMVREIGSYISDTFYNSPVKLKNGRNASNENALNFVDYNVYGHFVDGSTKNNSSKSKSLVNEYEGEIILNIIKTKLTDVSYDDIAVIAPYSGQVNYLRRILPLKRDNINTVDAFQGKDAKVVIYSCVRNSGKVTTFFKKPNRINVAISRAKDEIWIVGSKKYCSSVDYLEKFINYHKVSDMEYAVCNNYYYDGTRLKK